MASSNAVPRVGLLAFIVFANALAMYVLSLAPAGAVTTAASVAAASQPKLVSTEALFLVRCAMLGINLLAIALKLRTEQEKQVVHQAETKLERSVHVHISGVVWLTFFTLQSWLLQTFYLLGACACSANTLGITSLPLPSWLPDVLWKAYEVSFSVAILVSFIVKYVLIPTTAQKGLRVDNFFELPDLLMHNANTLFMAIELLFNSMPFELFHFPLAALWGAYYVFFSWWWMRTAGVCWYDFLDPTLPNATLIHAVLFVVLGVFFGVGAAFAQLATALESPSLRVAVVLTGVALVARTGLIRGIPVPSKPSGTTK